MFLLPMFLKVLNGYDFFLSLIYFMNNILYILRKLLLFLNYCINRHKNYCIPSKRIFRCERLNVLYL